MERRVLVPIVGQGSIVHIVRTGMLESMASFCTPIVALLWNEQSLVQELEAKGFEVYLIPKYEVSNLYSDTRSKIDVWYRTTKVKSNSNTIEKNYLAQFKTKNKSYYKKRIKEKLLKFRIQFEPGFADKLLTREEALIKQQPTYNLYKTWLDALNVNGLFTVTPFLHEVDLMARILRAKNIPIIASIHSFDNVTKRGWASTFFDHYIVWNQFNKNELERIHPPLKQANAITIAGAPQFDFHFDETYCWTKEEWLKRLGLPADKKIILFGGGPVSLFKDETQYLYDLKQAFDNKQLPENSVILFRCHPLDKMERWVDYVGASEHIIYDAAPNGTIKLDYTNVTVDDIKKLMSTLKYADVHINTGSSMCVDGSAFKRPQVGPYYDDMQKDVKLFRMMYHQEHYDPIVKSGVLSLAHDKKEFVDIMNGALQHPEKYINNSEDCLKTIITYTDGKSTDRAVAAIKKFYV